MVRYYSYCWIALLIMLGGCNPGIVDAPYTPDGEMADYFWPATIKSAIYLRQDLATGKSTKVELEFSGDNPNRKTVSDKTSSNTSSFSYQVNDDGVFVDNISGGSFLPLPEGFVIIGEPKEETVTRPRNMKRVVVTGQSSLIAIDEKDSVFFSKDLGLTWTLSEWREGRITSITTDERNVVFAGTAEGKILQSKTYGKSWTPISENDKPIVAIASFKDTLLFFAFDGGNVLRQVRASGAIEPAATTGMEHEATSLAIAGKLGAYFLIGGSDDGCFYTPIIPKVGAWTPSEGMDNCIAMVSAKNEVLYALEEKSDYTELFSSTNFGKSWLSYGSNASIERPTMLAYDATNQVLLLAGEHQISTIQNGSPQPPTTMDGRVNSISAGHTFYAAATDSGIYISTNLGETWTAIGRERFVEEEKVIHDQPGALRLMTGNDHSLDSGAYWEAGKCKGRVSGVSVNYYINAKVLSPQDSLQLPGGQKYADVIPIKYVFSSLKGDIQVKDLTPVIVIYYARNTGPVLINQYIGKTAITQLYRTD